ncbi:MAG: ATP/GTP-binding protein, partial [Actinomycetota bacterium]|nr:ATP/GTP-binding protein [Actinomycetota bacterium]
PGQDRFDFMWEILGEGMLGYILLVDSDRPDSLDEAASILASFRKMARVPFVVALNRSEGVTSADEDKVRSVLALGDEVAVVPCDATDRESVKAVLLALLYSVVDELDAAVADSAPARA